MSRNAETTRKNLEMALYRLQKGRGKIVKGGRLAVAKEAGVSAATIHNRHPEIAEQIRALQGKESRRQRDLKHEELQRIREANRALREENAELKADLGKLASINETLALENRVLRAERDGENVATLPRR